eukprot:SAG31_NODE_2373_length_5846_cov_1.932313_2_plen_76_part_00
MTCAAASEREKLQQLLRLRTDKLRAAIIEMATGPLLADEICFVSATVTFSAWSRPSGRVRDGKSGQQQKLDANCC